MNEYHEPQERLIKYNSTILILKWSRTLNRSRKLNRSRTLKWSRKLNWSRNSIGVETQLESKLIWSRKLNWSRNSNVVENSIGFEYFSFLSQRS